MRKRGTDGRTTTRGDADHESGQTGKGAPTTQGCPADIERRRNTLVLGLEQQDHQALSGVLDVAARLQRHNEKIFKLIDQTERRLMRLANEAAKAQPEVKRA